MQSVPVYSHGFFELEPELSIKKGFVGIIAAKKTRESDRRRPGGGIAFFSSRKTGTRSPIRSPTL